LLRREGFESEIFAEEISDELRARARKWTDFFDVDTPDSVLLAHYSIASPGMVSLPVLKSRIVILYHNITPHRYHIDVYPLVSYHCLLARAWLPRVASCASHGVAYSEFSARELKAAGMTQTTVIPLLVDSAQWDIPSDPFTLRMARNSGEKRILVVGRVAPNKKFEDAIKIASLVRNCRLIVAGSPLGCETYYHTLQRMASSLNVKCDFTGHISQAELNALYRTSDLMLVVSEHEGFCVPVIEAFYFELPVVAFSDAAVSETAGPGAILVNGRTPAEAAALIERMLSDAQLRSALKEAGARAYRGYRDFPAREVLLKIISA
jgi:glycosyltransferase involved in cell wall biosynthesis